MKYFNVIIVVIVSLYCVNANASDSVKAKTLNPESEALSQECNRESKNALIHEDLGLVEKVCMQAVSAIEKSGVDKEYVINPLMNLAFSYTMAGLYDKATPLYERARNMRVELYGPDSMKLKEIDRLIENQEMMKQQKTR